MVRRHKWLKIINVKTINSISCTIKNSYHHSIADTCFSEPEWCILAPYLHFLMSDPSEFLESTILTPSWSRCSEWSVQLIEMIRERKRTVRVCIGLNIVQKACGQYVCLRIACWTYLGLLTYYTHSCNVNAMQCILLPPLFLLTLTLIISFTISNMVSGRDVLVRLS